MSETYKGYRYPKVIMGHTVKYCHRYKLNLRDVSEFMLDGVLKPLMRLYVNGIRPGALYLPRWHIDEGRVKVNGIGYWLWRLVDSEGEDIEILVQKKRGAKAAAKF